MTDTLAKPLTLTAGKSYRTANDSKVGPMLIRGNYFTVAEPSPGFTLWYPDGRRFVEDPDLNIVAEWTDEPASPVHTATVTRTAIRPGTYGPVCVHALLKPAGMIDHWEIELETLRRMGPAELRAAALTLTQLADGLDAIAAERNAE